MYINSGSRRLDIPDFIKSIRVSGAGPRVGNNGGGYIDRAIICNSFTHVMAEVGNNTSIKFYTGQLLSLEITLQGADYNAGGNSIVEWYIDRDCKNYIETYVGVTGSTTDVLEAYVRVYLLTTPCPCRRRKSFVRTIDEYFSTSADDDYVYIPPQTKLMIISARGAGLYAPGAWMFEQEIPVEGVTHLKVTCGKIDEGQSGDTVINFYNEQDVVGTIVLGGGDQEGYILEEYGEDVGLYLGGVYRVTGITSNLSIHRGDNVIGGDTEKEAYIHIAFIQ
jgi:hypothetical protein